MMTRTTSRLEHSKSVPRDAFFSVLVEVSVATRRVLSSPTLQLRSEADRHPRINRMEARVGTELPLVGQVQIGPLIQAQFRAYFSEGRVARLSDPLYFEVRPPAKDWMFRGSRSP